ncbi:hypothetical protein B296_00041969 [Ensete ventricosum]|uniref:Uncharacterized protein n=1 Tax=Ensete ventricosum TaxID=4639 RepID=A0A426Y0D7_ENSVE|nr:hypothetical protein B296_00041969 [Ensete ventricosum]
MDAGSQRSALMPRSAGLLQFNAVHDGSLLRRGVLCCFLCWITVGRSAAMARRRHTYSRGVSVRSQLHRMHERLVIVAVAISRETTAHPPLTCHASKAMQRVRT